MIYPNHTETIPLEFSQKPLNFLAYILLLFGIYTMSSAQILNPFFSCHQTLMTAKHLEP